jgi:hypothetical protein
MQATDNSNVLFAKDIILQNLSLYLGNIHFIFSPQLLITKNWKT